MSSSKYLEEVRVDRTKSLEFFTGPGRCLTWHPMRVRGWIDWVKLGLAAAAMATTWFYGFWKGGDATLIWLPLGVVVFMCTLGALAVPTLTAVAAIVAFLIQIDKGPAAGIILAAKAFLAIGLVSFAWNTWLRLATRH